MAADALKQHASRGLQELIKSGVIQPPISAFNLLTKLISLPGASDDSPSFRLTDLKKLEFILEQLSESWDAGSISVLRDATGLTIMNVYLNGSRSPLHFRRKRKRPVDEDADSAEENEANLAASRESKSPTVPSINNLSKELQEIYALLQRGTARQKLLCEQVWLQLLFQGEITDN